MDYAYHMEKFPRRAVLSVATLGNAVGVSSTPEGSIKAARKKIKGVKDLKSIAFPKPTSDGNWNCTVSKDKKTKETSLSCTLN